MIPDRFRNALILTGPTACGKSSLGVELAERLGAEIISMDSMALYRRMDIGTAKPTAKERRRVPHHLVDALEPWESASVAWWLKEAACAVADIEARGKHVLFVGGTALYLKALLRGLFDGPPADLHLRRRLSEEADRGGGEALHQRLAAVDPAAAARLHPNDVRRLVRALEVWELTGRPISTWQQQWGPLQIADCRLQIETRQSAIYNLQSAIPSRCLWLDLPREELYARINARVDRMLADGLVEEVRGLRELPHPLSREAAQALGYKEIVAYLEGRSTLAEAVTQIKTRSRNFAKRQGTWFRQLPECRPVTAELTFAAWGLTMDK
jgi:tRNA dimethylallyltransferase